MAERVLVVDDDRQLTSFLERFLTKQGFGVASAGSATQMGLMLEHNSFDIIILDIGLPDIDGFEVIRQLRRNSSIPIILLTVRDEVYDRIIGLEMGADDYLSKPFEPRELLARIRAVLRRVNISQTAAEMTAKRYKFGELEIDFERRRVFTADGQTLPLTSTEFVLLGEMVRRAGQITRRAELVDVVYGGSIHVTDRAIDAHIARLRRKITESGGAPDIIQTMRGAGYTLACAVTPL